MNYYDYEYTRPIEAKGGIRAASRRGEFGSNWWAKRWIQTLEQFRIGARLSRGRSYARRGQVLSIDIQTASWKRRCRAAANDPTTWRSASGPSAQMTGNGCARRWPNSRSSPPACSPAGCRKTSRTRSKPSAYRCFPKRAMTSKPTARVLTGQTHASTLPPCTCSWARSSTATRSSSSACGEWTAKHLLGEEFRQSAQTIEGSPLAPEPLPEDPEAFWANPLPALVGADLGHGDGARDARRSAPAVGSVPLLAGRTRSDGYARGNLRRRVPTSRRHLPQPGRTVARRREGIAKRGRRIGAPRGAASGILNLEPYP